MIFSPCDTATSTNHPRIRDRPPGHAAALVQLPRLAQVRRHHHQQRRRLLVHPLARPRAASSASATTPSRWTSPAATSICATATAGDFWSAAWQPVGKPLDEYKTTCRFGTGYAVIDSQYSGIRTEIHLLHPARPGVRVLAPQGHQHRQEAAQARASSPSASSPASGTCMNDLLNLQYIMYIGRGALGGRLRRRLSCGRLAGRSGQLRQPRPEPLVVHDPARRPDRRLRLRPREVHRRLPRLRQPRGRRSRQVHATPTGFSDNICGAIQSDIDLAPGESAEIIVLLGIGKAGTMAPRSRRNSATPPPAETRTREAQGPLARPARQPAGDHARPRLRPHGQRLERLQRPDHLRVVALLLAGLHRRLARRLRLPRHRAGLPRRHRR